MGRWIVCLLMLLLGMIEVWLLYDGWRFRRNWKGNSLKIWFKLIYLIKKYVNLLLLDIWCEGVGCFIMFFNFNFYYYWMFGF